MKKIISLLIVSSFLLAGTIAESYKIQGMHCQFGCANKVQSLMSEIDGVEKCEVDFESSLMKIEYNDAKVTEDLILSTMTEKTTYVTRKVVDEKKSFWKKLKGIFS